MAIKETQMPTRYRDVVDTEVGVYKKPRTVEERAKIPDTPEIPIENRSHWFRIPDVICVFVDMKGSTLLSATNQDKSTAGAYQLFTETAVRLFDEFDAPYIDVRGDGIFALFNSDQPHRALAASVSFKTAVKEEVAPRINADNDVQIAGHYGIDIRTVLVRKIGLKRRDGRTDRQNEVWAGRPVNMASKLASIAGSDRLLVSDRYYKRLTGKEARESCGCGSDGVSKALWDKVDVSDDAKFDFDTAYRLQACWCEKHGAEYCDRIMAYDK